MKQPEFSNDWPESWKNSYHYDTVEFWGPPTDRGYRNAYHRRFEATLNMVRKNLPKGAAIVDVAAAQGNFSLALAEEGYEVTWNDLRAELEDYIRLKYEKGILHYAPGNCFELKFPSLFDAAVITEIIEHVAHPDEFLQKIASLVKPGGYIFMSTPNGNYFKNRLPKFSDCKDPSIYEDMQFKPNSDGHIFLMHEDEFKPLAASAGLELLEVQMFTNPLTHGHVKTEPLLRVMPSGLVRALESMTNSLPRPLVRKLHSNTAVLLRKPAKA